MRSDPDVFMPRGGDKGQNLVLLLRTDFFKNFFDETN